MISVLLRAVAGCQSSAKPPLSKHPARGGTPVSPKSFAADEVLLRYMYDGGTLSQGRLCSFLPQSTNAATGAEVQTSLAKDGVDLERFYATVYETAQSTGGWVRCEDEGMQLPLDDWNDDVEGPVARRIDVKLFPREVAADMDANRAQQMATPSGDIPISGYFGIGVVNTKNQANVGTLWRSAYQLGSSFIFTIGTRYRHAPTDTVRATQRLPMYEHDSWNSFVESAPRGARWVAVEFGGTPLEEFEHPLDAVYILGSEDAGLPKAVLRACHSTVSLRAERYASFNVAIAGSLIMYDRQTKMRARRGQTALPAPDGIDAS
jgi:tRNA G18 (ribose-2'-O)-methylase SpoU